jgi:phosphohistidine swiveling domain-containing protein
MRLAKYITRNYKLRDHVLIVQSLYKKNTTIPEIYYENVADISVKGLMDIYINPLDLQNNIKRLQKVINKPNYISSKIKEGERAVKNLYALPLNLKKKNLILNKSEIIRIIKIVRKKLFEFGGFFEFTHYIGRTNAKLTSAQIKKLGIFHNRRKDAFLTSFNFLNILFEKTLKNTKIINKKLDFLTIEEIIDYFNGKIDEGYINREQARRMKRYICIYRNQKEKIITNGFSKEFNKIRGSINVDKSVGVVQGSSINKGVVRGKVKIITQNTRYQKIPKKAIIVTQMSTPEMTPFLRNAKALITDEGGLLCHAAIFAREFKIITILGTKIATQVLKDGDLVEVDANRGIIKKL